MSGGFSIRRAFNAFAAATVLALSAPFAEAAEPSQKPRLVQVHQKKTKPAIAKKTVTTRKKAAGKNAPRSQKIAGMQERPAASPVPPKPVFVPFSPTGEACPAPDADGRAEWIVPSFDVSAREQMVYLSGLGFQIGRHRPDGFFNERATQSVNEFRLLSAGRSFRESMSEEDFEAIKSFSQQARQDMQNLGLDEEEATAYRFAANRTRQDIATIRRTRLPPDTAGWLYLVDTFGKKYGLGYFSRHIETTRTETEVTLSVADPVALKQIMDLRSHPRISVMMRAEYALNGADFPALVMQESAADALEQSRLRLLGFDLGGEESRGVKGPHTKAALLKFDRLFGPATGFFGTSAVDPEKSREVYLRLFSEQAEKDASTYGISTAAAAAIRLANIRTGADFGYMMELSSAESSFDPEAEAATSSATGLYQFTEDTWLHMLRSYGEKYGMAALADQIQATDNMYGVLVARAENPYVRATALELRKDPHIAALMSAEFQMRNKFIVECSVGHALNRTEQYLAHFLGSRGAAAFLNRMAETPHANAARMFPTAASANKSIFYARDKKGRLLPRTLRQVYGVLDRKFETGSYEDHGVRATAQREEPGQPLMPPANPEPPQL